MRRLLLAPLAAAAALLASSAFALPTLAGVGSYNLGTASPTGATASPQTSCGGGGQDALVFTGAGANSIGIHSYSCGLGNYEFGSRSSGQNTYFVDGSASVSGNISTAGGFGFVINSGQVGAFGSSSFAAGEFQESSLSIKLVIDGNTYIDQFWSASVSAGGAITTVSTSTGPYGISSTFATDASGGTGNYFSYGLFGQSFYLDTSLVGDGDHVISYVMTSMARGNVLSGGTACVGINNPPGDIGVEGAAAIIREGQGDGSFQSFCGAGAQSGDPFPPLANAFVPGTLPEPMTAGLTLTALLAAAGVRRRRQG
jgi:hypothetical protein